MKGKALTYGIPVLAAILLGAGTVSARGFMRAETPEQIVERHEEIFAHHAEILGISEDEFKDAWANGKTIQDIAKEKGISEEDLRAKMKESMKARMQDLVEKGVISKEQAAKRLETMTTRMEEHKKEMGGMMDHKGMMGKKIRHKGMMGGMGFHEAPEFN